MPWQLSINVFYLLISNTRLSNLICMMPVKSLTSFFIIFLFLKKSIYSFYTCVEKSSYSFLSFIKSFLMLTMSCIIQLTCESILSSLLSVYRFFASSCSCLVSHFSSWLLTYVLNSFLWTSSFPLIIIAFLYIALFVLDIY